MKDEQSVDEYMAEQEIDEREERESQEPSEGYYDSSFLGEENLGFRLKP